MHNEILRSHAACGLAAGDTKKPWKPRCKQAEEVRDTLRVQPCMLHVLLSGAASAHIGVSLHVLPRKVAAFREFHVLCASKSPHVWLRDLARCMLATVFDSLV